MYREQLLGGAEVIRVVTSGHERPYKRDPRHVPPYFCHGKTSSKEKAVGELESRPHWTPASATALILDFPRVWSSEK